MKIGVFDSGLGGLTVLKQFLEHHPNKEYIYLGDNARVPYGNKSSSTVKNYSEQATRFLVSRNVDAIVIACNTSSAEAMEEIKIIAAGRPVIGMIEPAARSAFAKSKNKKIGIIGTRGTIKSGAYSDKLKSLDSAVQVFERACPLFVPFAEEGQTSSEALKLVAEEYLQEFISLGIDTLILGCTHYPFLRKIISELLPNVKIIDTGESAALHAKELFADSSSNNNHNSKAQCVFFATDEPSHFIKVAREHLNLDIGFIETVVL
jgi:glutamate racemase